MKNIFLTITTLIAMTICLLPSCYEEDTSGSGSSYIYMFQTTSRYTGDLLSADTEGTVRGNVDKICSNEAANNHSSLPVSTVKGFISISADDEIRDLDFPSDRAIVSPSGKTIADDRDDLLDGSITDTLSNLLGIDYWWWSGSNIDGSIASHTCNSWTSGSSADGGETGLENDAGNSWIDWTGGNGSLCTSHFYIMCIGW